MTMVKLTSYKPLRPSSSDEPRRKEAYVFPEKSTDPYRWSSSADGIVLPVNSNRRLPKIHFLRMRTANKHLTHKYKYTNPISLYRTNMSRLCIMYHRQASRTMMIARMILVLITVMGRVLMPMTTTHRPKS